MTKKAAKISFILILLSLLVSLGQATSYSSKTINASGSVRPNRIVYFQSTFHNEGPNGFKLYDSWPQIEPSPYPTEKGTWHWVNCGPNYGTIRLVPDPSDSSGLCLEMLLDAPGTRPLSTNQQVKLYEIQSREANNYAEPYPTSKEAYWQMKYWFPANLKVATNSWRLIWQLNGEEYIYGNPNYTYAPQFALIFGDDYLYLQMAKYYFSDGQTRSFQVIKNTDLPKERWVSIVVFMKQGSTFRTEDGTIVVWIDGVKLFEQHDLPTSTYSGTPYVIWSIGNYGGPYEPEGQYIYIKDVFVTNEFSG